MTIEELQLMRNAGRATAAVLDYIAPFVQAGTTTEEIDDLCRQFIIGELKAEPASLNYCGFPKSICTSVNHVVAHGIPNNYVLFDGDIVNLDVAVKLQGYFGDASRMFCIGNVSKPAEQLVEWTKEAMWAGIFEVKPNKTTGDIGNAIMQSAIQHKLGIVANYCGHGIGNIYHGPLEIQNIGVQRTGVTLQPGMIFTVEPMLTLGSGENYVEKDGWTVVTKDRSWSAQWEHTVLVTDDGFEILTLGENEKIPIPYKYIHEN